MPGPGPVRAQPFRFQSLFARPLAARPSKGGGPSSAFFPESSVQGRIFHGGMSTGFGQGGQGSAPEPNKPWSQWNQASQASGSGFPTTGGFMHHFDETDPNRRGQWAPATGFSHASTGPMLGDPSLDNMNPSWNVEAGASRGHQNFPQQGLRNNHQQPHHGPTSQISWQNTSSPGGSHPAPLVSLLTQNGPSLLNNTGGHPIAQVQHKPMTPHMNQQHHPPPQQPVGMDVNSRAPGHHTIVKKEVFGRRVQPPPAQMTEVISATNSVTISPAAKAQQRAVAPPPQGRQDVGVKPMPNNGDPAHDPPGLNSLAGRPTVIRSSSTGSHGFGRRPPPTQPTMKARAQLRPAASSPSNAVHQDNRGMTNEVNKRPTILASLRQATRTDARPPTPTKTQQNSGMHHSPAASPISSSNQGYKNPPPAKPSGPKPNLSQLKRQWMERQRKLKSRMIIPENEKDSLNLEDVGLIAGIDIGHWRENKKTAKELCVALVVYSYPKFQEVYRDAMVFPVTAPYVSGFLAFREVEPLVRLFDKLRQTTPIFLPDVTLVHANGTLHFRGFGLACHFGVLADVPCIGVASSPLVFDGLTFENVRRDAQNLKPGDHHLLVGRSGKTHGAALGVHNGSSIYVSIGNKISLRAAVEVVNACCDTSRGKLTRPIPLISAGRITRLQPTALTRWLEDRDTQKNGSRAGKARPAGQKLIGRGTPLITVARTTAKSSTAGADNVWKRRRAANHLSGRTG